MLCVKTIVKGSPISGLGLFADEDIQVGTIVWRFESKLDTRMTKADVDLLSKEAQRQFLNYAFYDKDRNAYILCGDDARFFNHCDDPNCDDSNCDITIANRNIMKGEELTVDYRSFDLDLVRHTFLE